MKLTLFILALIFQMSASSQKIERLPIQAISESLKSKSYSKFIDAIHKLRKKTRFDVWTNYYREIIDDYKEGSYDISNAMPLESGVYPKSDSAYKLKIITEKDLIISYEFSERKFKKREDSIGYTYWENINSFKNTVKFTNFKSHFKTIYGIELNESDLCLEKMVGSWCGLGANMPLDDYSKMEGFLKNQNRDSLMMWLKSANTEKQMFGLWAFSILFKDGQKLTESELNFIKLVSTRKGILQNCGGCEVMNTTIQKFIKDLGLRWN